MKLEVKKTRLKVNYWQFLRSAGYHQDSGRSGQISFSKSLTGGRYPRFHLYIQEESERLIFNLHLDQKQPSYAGQTAHSGEYDGELVEQELARLQTLIEAYG